MPSTNIKRHSGLSDELILVSDITPFSWSKSIDEAKKTGKFTMADNANVRTLETGALGERIRLEGITSFRPCNLKPSAHTTAMSFTICVLKGNVVEAEKYYNEIMGIKSIWDYPPEKPYESENEPSLWEIITNLIPIRFNTK